MEKRIIADSKYWDPLWYVQEYGYNFTREEAINYWYEIGWKNVESPSKYINVEHCGKHCNGINPIIAYMDKNVVFLPDNKNNYKEENDEKRFTRVVFETKQNEGTCITLNKLIDLSKGEYIYLIASDDLAKSQAIEKELSFLAQNPEYGLCVNDNEIIDNNGNKCYWNKKRNNVYKESDAKYKTFVEFLQNSRRDIDFNSENFGSYESLYIGNYIPNGYLIKNAYLTIFVLQKKLPWKITI